MRAKITSLKPFLMFVAGCVLLAVALSTEQRNGLPSGIGWAAFVALAAGLLYVFR